MYRGLFFALGARMRDNCPVSAGHHLALDPALIISSGLFALAHVLNPFSPLYGHFGLDWVWGAGALLSGYVFGLVRLFTGSLFASITVHVVSNIVLALASPWVLR